MINKQKNPYPVLLAYAAKLAQYYFSDSFTCMDIQEQWNKNHIPESPKIWGAVMKQLHRENIIEYADYKHKLWKLKES